MSDFQWGIRDRGSSDGTAGIELVLDGAAWTTHFMLFWFPGAFFILLVIAKVVSSWNPRWHGPPALLALAPLPLSLLGLWRQKRLLRFKKFETGQGSISNCNMVRALAESKRWEIVQDDEPNMLRIRTSPSMASFGEILTVLFRGSQVLVNCIADPNFRPSAFAPLATRISDVASAVGGEPA